MNQKAFLFCSAIIFQSSFIHSSSKPPSQQSNKQTPSKNKIPSKPANNTQSTNNTLPITSNATDNNTSSNTNQQNKAQLSPDEIKQEIAKGIQMGIDAENKKRGTDYKADPEVIKYFTDKFYDEDKYLDEKINIAGDLSLFVLAGICIAFVWAIGKLDLYQKQKQNEIESKLYEEKIKIDQKDYEEKKKKEYEIKMESEITMRELRAKDLLGKIMDSIEELQLSINKKIDNISKMSISLYKSLKNSNESFTKLKIGDFYNTLNHIYFDLHYLQDRPLSIDQLKKIYLNAKNMLSNINKYLTEDVQKNIHEEGYIDLLTVLQDTTEKINESLSIISDYSRQFLSKKKFNGSIEFANKSLYETEHKKLQIFLKEKIIPRISSAEKQPKRKMSADF